MNKTPLFRPNGDGYDIQPAGVLILLASQLQEEPDHPANGRIQAIIDKMLAAARAGGFKQGDILMTLLANGEVSHRVKDMAVAAMAAAGNDAIDRIFEEWRQATRGGFAN